MKKNIKNRLLPGCLIAVTLLMHASVSLGYQLIQATQVDTIDFSTSTAGISFGAINSRVWGSVNSNGSVVTSGMSGTGSMATGVDGSSGPLGLTGGNGVDQFASIDSQVVAIPYAPTSASDTTPINPLTSDVYLLASDTNIASAGSLNTASSTYYRQDFSITSSGLLGVSALSVANNFFYLDPGEVLPGGLYNYSSFKLWLDGLLIQSISGSRFIDALNDAPGQDYIFNNFLVNPFNVLAGQTGYLEINANNNVVPEPGTFLLVGAGLAGLVFYRRRKSA